MLLSLVSMTSGIRTKNLRVLRIIVGRLSVVFGVLTWLAASAADSRILLFQKFNRATTYDEVRPLVSGDLARGLEFTSRQHPDLMGTALNYLQFISYEPHIVELNPNNSFLVLEHGKPRLGRDNHREERAVYLLSRVDGINWTIARRMERQQIITSLWFKDFSPAEFNQQSSCSVSGNNVDPTLNGKEWSLQSAVAFRKMEDIEIDLFPFVIKQADLDYWKFWSGMPIDSNALQASSMNHFQPECRIVFGLDQNGQVKFVNVGFNNPTPHLSAVWQGPGWSWALPQFPKPNTSSGLPPEFRTFEVTKDRIKLDTAGQLEAGGQTIHWKVKVDIPILDKGL
jgi:hypothetical protein